MLGPQCWHPNIVPMKNYYIDKSAKSGNKRLNLVMEFAKFGDVSKVRSGLLTTIVLQVSSGKQYKRGVAVGRLLVDLPRSFAHACQRDHSQGH
jgi:hypothetical protein